MEPPHNSEKGLKMSGEKDVRSRASLEHIGSTQAYHRDGTRRMLKPRHIQFIGIGGTIGTALYVRKNPGPNRIHEIQSFPAQSFPVPLLHSYY
jgi:amino acid permease